MNYKLISPYLCGVKLLMKMYVVRIITILLSIGFMSMTSEFAAARKNNEFASARKNNVSAAFASSSAPDDSVVATLPQAREVETPRFAVISDTHFENNVGEGAAVKVPRTLKNLLFKQPLPDAVFVVGDLTNRGKREQYEQLLDVFGDSTNVPKSVAVYFMMGYQHDKSETNGPEVYLETVGQPLHQYIEIKGYPFITISEGGRRETPHNLEARRFLDEKMTFAAAKFPGKPIFVFMHIPPLNTCYGSGQNEGWGTDFFLPVLERYPQAIVFSGHSHFPLGDPRSIHQGAFTAVNDGSVSCSEVEPNAVDAGVNPENYENVTEGVIVSVMKNGDVEIERRDTYRDEEIHPCWTVEAPHDGSRFAYKNRNGLPAPVFAEGARPAVAATGNGELLVVFPQARDNEAVHHYIVELLEGKRTIAARRIFSQFYLNSAAPKELSAKFTEVPPRARLTVRVTAADSYGNLSAPAVTDYEQ
jgi:predicted phosphodiesterase